MDRPEIRASYLQGNLVCCKALGAEKERAVRARLGAAVQTIEQAARSAWLPLTLDVELTEAIYEVAGEEGIIEVNRQSFLSAVEGPLLRPILSSALRMLGASPWAILRFLPTLQNAATRNFGIFHIEREADDLALITHHHLPDELVGNHRYMVGLIGLFRGVCEVTRHEGRVDITELDEGRAFRIQLTWKRMPPTTT